MGLHGEAEVFDVVVIGAGPAGEVVAQYVAENSQLSVAIVEEELLGGECSYYACIPSKALLTPVALSHQSSRLTGVAEAPLGVEQLLSRRDSWVSGYQDRGQVRWAEQLGISVVRGRGRLLGERKVEVLREEKPSKTVLEARRAVVIATGSEAVVPDPLSDAVPWTSRDATGIRDVPRQLLIVGGGVVACEAATWMNALGSQVTMLVRGETLLPGSEDIAHQTVLDALKGQGVTVHLDTTVTGAHRDMGSSPAAIFRQDQEPMLVPGPVLGSEPEPGAELRATAQTDSGEKPQPSSRSDYRLGRLRGARVIVETSTGTFRADELLVATGRRPRLGGIGLETVGLTPEKLSEIGDRPLPWLHLVGDSSSEAPLTHWGKYQARRLGERIAGAGGSAGEDPPASLPASVPQVVFTDPAVSSVGMTEQAATEAGYDVVVSSVEAGAVAGVGLLQDDPAGGGKIVVDRASGQLLGATFVGPGLAEVVHAATVAIVGRVPVWVLRHAVASFPAASEIWLNLLEQLPAEFKHRHSRVENPSHRSSYRSGP